MKTFISHKKCISLIFLSLSSFTSYADPPTNVARLSFINGTVSFSPAGSNDWAVATLNRPIVNGDRLWDDAGGKSELQFSDSAIRMNEKTSINALNLADKTAQIQLSQGSVCLHIKSISTDQIYEIDTPNLAFSVLQAGDYRIDVRADGKSTSVTVNKGASQVSSEKNTFNVNENQTVTFTGTDLKHKETTTPQSDDFDSWCSDRNASLDTPTSNENVSDKMPGSQDLTNNGTWSNDNKYGKVWTPKKVSSGWTPYRDGHWVWLNGFGWTWVDNAPWGYAPFHYGRWVLIGDIWRWVPGPYNAEPVFVPALVGFIGGLRGPNGILIGWFPLGPGELYIPSYIVGIDYLRNININNTNINITLINNYFNNPVNNPRVYVNIRRPDAVTAMNPTNFANSDPVGQSQVPVDSGMLDHGKMMNNPGTAPTNKGLMGSSQTSSVPPSDVLGRPGIAKTEPPPPPIPFSAEIPLLKDHPGIPLSSTEVDTLKPGQGPIITVIKTLNPPATNNNNSGSCGIPKPPENQPVVKTHEPVKVKIKPTEPKKVKVQPTPPKKVKVKPTPPKKVKKYPPEERIHKKQHHRYHEPQQYYPQQNYSPPPVYYGPPCGGYQGGGGCGGYQGGGCGGYQGGGGGGGGCGGY